MKFSHTSITVRNMDESLKFYTKGLGLDMERRREIPENHAEIAFVREPASGMRIELTWWKDKKELTEGDQLDHLAFEVPDLEEAIRALELHGAKLAKAPYQLQGGSGRIAFVHDPNGIWIELLERRGTGEKER
ncbi:MAG: VOC family protein [Euryarchaeota archaeon]|nr:VOC family protein [Euryarchaeota archaeon]MDE1835261.1 VOC family protein [Euryarchaeota archaeon]MDE1881077.1 VOC family protein [Euryarchaeota archaeon]MDE2043557.1 VOC family protein [Thermoplasmata archaeon]